MVYNSEQEEMNMFGDNVSPEVKGLIQKPPIRCNHTWMKLLATVQMGIINIVNILQMTLCND